MAQWFAVALLPRQKLFFLRYAVLKATAASQTLLAWLAAKVSSHGDSIVSGKILVSASAGGTSSGYSTSGGTGINPQNIAEFWDEALELYDIASAALVDSGIASPTQTQIVAEMRFRLSPVESADPDFADEWSGPIFVEATA